MTWDLEMWISDIAGEDYHNWLYHRCANNCGKTEYYELMVEYAVVHFHKVNKQYFKSRNIGVYAKHWGWTIPASAQDEDIHFWNALTALGN